MVWIYLSHFCFAHEWMMPVLGLQIFDSLKVVWTPTFLSHEKLNPSWNWTFCLYRIKQFDICNKSFIFCFRDSCKYLYLLTYSFKQFTISNFMLSGYSIKVSFDCPYLVFLTEVSKLMSNSAQTPKSLMGVTFNGLFLPHLKTWALLA